MQFNRRLVIIPLYYCGVYVEYNRLQLRSKRTSAHILMAAVWPTTIPMTIVNKYVSPATSVYEKIPWSIDNGKFNNQSAKVRVLMIIVFTFEAPWLLTTLISHKIGSEIDKYT